MKKIILLCVALIVIPLAITNYLLVPKALKNIEKYFDETGFNNVEINNAHLQLNGINIESVKLGKDGFNVAKNIRARIFWPTYIFTSHIKSINIVSLKISSTANNPNDILKYEKILNIGKFSNIKVDKILIEKITWDIATPKNALRLEGRLTLQQNGGVKDINATLNAAQHELSFTSKWSGHIESDGNYNIETIFNGLDIHTKSFMLKRGTGWAFLSNKDKKTNITAQLDAGNGNILNIPTKNISLVLNQGNGFYSVVTRSNASAIEGVNLYGDFHFSNDINKQAFELLLEIDNPNKFISYLSQQNILKNPVQSTTNLSENIDLQLIYEPENRFANGPFPFSLNIKKKDKDSLKGTFLIYPNNLDIRGTAQGDQETISLLQTLFSINEDNISDQNIRFDDSLKNLL